MILDQNKTPLFDAVKYHVQRNAIPLQIPGHKHGYGLKEYKEFVGENVLKMDLNETRGIDVIWDHYGHGKGGKTIVRRTGSQPCLFFN